MEQLRFTIALYRAARHLMQSAGRGPCPAWLAYRPVVWLRRLLAMVGGAAAGLLLAASRPRPDTVPPTMPEPPAGLPSARIVTVPGRGEMFFRDAPGPGTDAPTILLLHGWLYPADLTWFGCYEALARHGRLLAPDHRGHGRGLRPSTPFRLADVADDVAALLRHLETPPVIAVGYSMGGPVAQLLWQRHPDVVGGLVLCATGAGFATRAHDRLLWRGMGLLQLLLRLLPRHWWQRLFELQARGAPLRLSGVASKAAPPTVRALLPWVISELDRGSAEDVAEAGRELGRYDARGWLPTVDVPSAVVITGRDRFVPLGNQRELAGLMPDALVVQVPLDHDAVVAGARRFVPALERAVSHVAAKSRSGQV